MVEFIRAFSLAMQALRLGIYETKHTPGQHSRRGFHGIRLRTPEEKVDTA